MDRKVKRALLLLKTLKYFNDRDGDNFLIGVGKPLLVFTNAKHNPSSEININLCESGVSEANTSITVESSTSVARIRFYYNAEKDKFMEYTNGPNVVVLNKEDSNDLKVKNSKYFKYMKKITEKTIFKNLCNPD